MDAFKQFIEEKYIQLNLPLFSPKEDEPDLYNEYIRIQEAPEAELNAEFEAEAESDAENIRKIILQNIQNIINDKTIESELTWLPLENHRIVGGFQYKQVNFDLGLSFGWNESIDNGDPLTWYDRPLDIQNQTIEQSFLKDFYIFHLPSTHYLAQKI